MASTAHNIAQALSDIKRSLAARKRSGKPNEVPRVGSARGMAAMRAGQPVCMNHAPAICYEAVRGTD